MGRGSGGALGRRRRGSWEKEEEGRASRGLVELGPSGVEEGRGLAGSKRGGAWWGRVGTG